MTEIVKRASSGELAQLSKGDMFNSITEDTNTIKFLQLAQGQSKCVTESMGAVNPGDWVFYGKHEPIGDPAKEVNIHDGKSYLDVIAGHWRFKAIYIAGGAVQKQSFDPTDPVFKEIMAKSKNRIEGHTWQYGIEYLFLLPKFECWATFAFMKTARQYAQVIGEDGMGKHFRLVSKTASAKGNTWWVPAVIPLDNDPVDLTDQAYIDNIMNPFVNPEGGEVVEDSAAPQLDR